MLWFELSICTGVSVHRRGRRTCTPNSAFLLVSFCCLPLLFLSSCLFALLWSCATCLSTAVFVLSSFSLSVLCLYLCCPVVLVSLCFRWCCGPVVSFGLVLLAVLVRSSVFPVLPAPPCCASCLCLSCLPCPACSLFSALVQLTLLCAGASLGVSGCSCDGSVALLSGWECGLALLSLRHAVHGNKGSWPCVGFSPSTPCYWCRRGA